MSHLGRVFAQRAFFAVSAVATAAGLLLAIRYLPERPTVSAARLDHSLRAVSSLVRGGASRSLYAPGANRGYWALRRFRPVALARRLSTDLGLYFLAIVCAFTGFAAFFGPLPAFLRDAGYATDRVFALFVVSSAASAALYATAGRLAANHGPERVQIGALSARALLFPVVAVVGAVGASGFPALFVLFAGVGATWAVIAVTATGVVTRLAPPAVRGNALGAYAALSGVGTGVGSLFGGAVAGAAGYLMAFGVAALLVLLGVAVALFEYRRPNGRGADA